MAAALYVGCIGNEENADNELRRCATITGLDIPNLNYEITRDLNQVMGINFCTEIRESLAARQKCAIASPEDGRIILDPRMYLPPEQLFVKLAHEYAHIVYNHVSEPEYLEGLLEWDNCSYMPRFNEMEKEADHFAGYLAAVSGRRINEGIFFLTDGVNDRYFYPTTCYVHDLPDCVAEHYTNEERVEQFTNGYNEYSSE